MPQMIDYAGKSDRDLLIELVVQGNSSVSQRDEIVERLARLNGDVARNTARSLDNRRLIDERTVPAWMQSRVKVGGLAAAATATAATIATITMEILKRYLGG